MKITRIFLIFCFIVIGLYSCKKSTIDPVDVGYSYFPVNIGHEVIYEVDSTVWDEFYPDTSELFIRNYHYYIKEVVESEYYDNEGRLTQRLERYQKLCDTCDWFIKDVWSLNKTATSAEKVEENYRFVKMAFPVQSSSTWNGNAFINSGSYIYFPNNTLDDQDYEYDDLYETFTVNSLSFDSTVTVIEKDDSSKIDAYKQYEVYSKNIGMIFRRYRAVEISVTNNVYKVLNGIDYNYKIISYGN